MKETQIVRKKERKKCRQTDRFIDRKKKGRQMKRKIVIEKERCMQKKDKQIDRYAESQKNRYKREIERKKY